MQRYFVVGGDRLLPSMRDVLCLAQRAFSIFNFQFSLPPSYCFIINHQRYVHSTWTIMLTFLILGISFGLSASVNPGPSLTLAISRALRDGARSGMLVTLAPLCTDAPIIAVATLLIGSLPPSVFGWLGIVGGSYIIWLGIRGVRDAWGRQIDLAALSTSRSANDDGSLRSLFQAMIINFLNPNPYLFWGTAGAPNLVKAWQQYGVAGASLFIFGFYLMLVGIRAGFALVIGRNRNVLSPQLYQRILLISGVLLAFLGCLLVRDGIVMLWGNK
jgi:threonine/homoserine/homoserine lactone efflux protein